jgi:hypothetical protein
MLPLCYIHLSNEVLDQAKGHGPGAWGSSACASCRRVELGLFVAHPQKEAFLSGASQPGTRPHPTANFGRSSAPGSASRVAGRAKIARAPLALLAVQAVSHARRSLCGRASAYFSTRAGALEGLAAHRQSLSRTMRLPLPSRMAVLLRRPKNQVRAAVSSGLQLSARPRWQRRLARSQTAGRSFAPTLSPRWRAAANRPARPVCPPCRQRPHVLAHSALPVRPRSSAGGKLR